jgi:uncharacterized protein with HEPN domain
VTLQKECAQLELLLTDFYQGKAIRDFGEEDFFSRFELKLSAESLSIHLGESLKRLSIITKLDIYSTGIYKLAMKNRDFVAHKYDQIDHATLWRTLGDYFPELEILSQARLEKLEYAEHRGSADN